MLTALRELEEAGCGIVVVVQPTMSNGLLAHTLADSWRGGIMLWATPERPPSETDRVSSCALVGNHLFASILARKKRPFELLYSDSLESDPVDSLKHKLGILSTIVECRHLRAVVIGGTAPGFTNMQTDGVTWSEVTGIRILNYPLQEYLEACASISDADAAADMLEVDKLNLPFNKVERHELISNSRLYLALKRLRETEKWDIVSLKCWPEIPDLLNTWPYLALFRMTEQGIPNAMEGDVEGAISLAMAYRLGSTPGVLMDWIHHCGSTITLWHPGNAPLGLSDPSGTGFCRHGRHFNNDKPGVVESVIRSGLPVTLFRFWESDGCIHLDGLEGQTIPVKHPLMGTSCQVSVNGVDVDAWFDEACHRGMAHHVALIAGHWMNDFRRLLDRIRLAKHAHPFDNS